MFFFVTMSFSLGITYEQFSEGFCDILLLKDKDLTMEQLQDIIAIAEPILLSDKKTGSCLDTLMSIADVIRAGNTVELDLNLQHYGMRQFGQGAVDPSLHFIRHDRVWPDNGFTYRGDVHALHSFLFSA